MDCSPTSVNRGSETVAGQRLLRALRARSIPHRWLVVAPHPDDETVSAGIAISRMTDASIVCVTDGAPRDPRLWTARVPSRAAYGRTRQRELRHALTLAGVDPRRVSCLGFVDQEATWHIAACARKLSAIIAQCRPDAVIASPYEGGHPDHDATALAARLAIALAPLKARPTLVESTSYHLFRGGIRTGKFLDDNAALPPARIALTGADRARKDKMLAAYVSQRAVLAQFCTSHELFRIAPACDFSRPPHPRPLFYEALGWPISWTMWRDAAAAATAEIRP